MRRASGVVILLLLLPAGAVLAQERAGVSAAVRGRVDLTREAQQVASRQIGSGEDILLRDLIESGPDSGMQVLLLDETVFTIGPDSAITIDEFVYDPDTDAGNLSAEVVKGVFRFVTGKVAERDPSAMEVGISRAGTIGIRGTMVAGLLRPDGSALVFLLGAGPNNDPGAPPGAFVAEGAGVREWIHAPGWGAELFPGQPPRVVRVDPRLIAEITAQLANPAGAGGGAPAASFRPDHASGELAARGAAHAAFAADVADLGQDLWDHLVDAAENAQDRLVDIASLDQIPFGTASYVGSAGLSDGGFYDFAIGLDFGQRAVFADFFNIEAPSLFLSSGFASVMAPFDSGAGGLASFEDLPGGVQGCPMGCSAEVDLLFLDGRSPPTRSDHQIRISEDFGTNEVLGGATGVPLDDFGGGER